MQFRLSLTTSILVMALVHGPSASVTRAQSAPHNPVDTYVRQALRASLSLAQAQLGADQAAAAVREPRGLRLPTVAFSSRRTRVDGGLDLGNLVNPAYRALNPLTGTSAFPTNVGLTL